MPDLSVSTSRQPAFSWNWDRVDATQAAELSLRQWTQTTEHEINEQPESSMMAVKSVFASPEADAGRVDDKEVSFASSGNLEAPFQEYSENLDTLHLIDADPF